MTLKDTYIFYIQFWLLGTIKGKIKRMIRR
jgi:hypothetical protein